MVEVEKRPGADWDITYMEVPDGNIETMTVYGAVSLKEALADAEQSLSAFSEEGADDDYEIISIVRQP